MADATTNEIVDVKGCQRCGRDHHGMIFTPLVNAVDKWRHWSRCPVTNQPVLLAVGDRNQTAATDDAGESPDESIAQLLAEVE